MSEAQSELDGTANELARSASAGTATISYVGPTGSLVTLTPELTSQIASRATRKHRDFSEDDEARTTPFGLLRYAHSYGHAAQLVAASVKDGGHASPVASMLLGHSIELSLKAFLRSRGATLADVHRLGHDLGKAYKRAKRKRIDRLIHLPDAYGRSISEYGKHHMGGEFRYIRNGYKSIPSWTDMSTIAILLTTNLRAHCLRATFGREAARKIIATRGDRF